MDIVIVNSDPEVERQLQALLERQGHYVHPSANVPEALSFLRAQHADVLIAGCDDLALHGSGLFPILGHLPRPPLILPTASRQGADHPPSTLPADIEEVKEIAAQVQRLLASPTGETLQVGDLLIDMPRKRVLLHGQHVPLPPIQYRLLLHLARNAGRVVGAQELLRAVWGFEEDESDARELVKVHIRQLRRRLGLAMAGPEYVQSVRGFGYMVTVPGGGA